jgi:hypothetical protein
LAGKGKWGQELMRDLIQEIDYLSLAIALCNELVNLTLSFSTFLILLFNKYFFRNINLLLYGSNYDL